MLRTLAYYFSFNLVYHLTSFIFYIIDNLQIYNHCKVQPKKDYLTCYNLCKNRVLANTLGWAILPCAILALYAQWVTVVPFSICQCILHLLFATLVTDVTMYFCHRLLHLPLLYQKYHKLHHQISAPVGFSAVYMTPVDFYLGNVLPITLPLIIIGAHSTTIEIWLLLVTINTIALAHSGFNIASFHDKHHSSFTKNYGTNVFMDKLLGTKHS